MPRIHVTHAGTYEKDRLHVNIRRDFNRTSGWAFISSPGHFAANPEQLRELADAMHDWADQLENPRT